MCVFQKDKSSFDDIMIEFQEIFYFKRIRILFKILTNKGIKINKIMI